MNLHLNESVPAGALFNQLHTNCAETLPFPHAIYVEKGEAIAIPSKAKHAVYTKHFPVKAVDGWWLAMENTVNSILPIVCCLIEDIKNRI